MYRILMVENDQHEGETLRDFLERYGSEHGESFRVTWDRNAFELSDDRRQFDLIFMAIDLPGINGMEAAEIIRTYDEATPLIFVSKLAKYAVRGYGVNALGFIIKPVTYTSLEASMDKAMPLLRESAGRRIVVPVKGGARTFEISDLIYVDVSDHDLVYHLLGGESLRIRGSLRQLEGELAGQPLVRISSGCLVNMNHIVTAGGGELHMSDGTTLYFSRAKRSAALEAITSFLGEGA